MAEYSKDQVSKTLELNLKGIKKKDWQAVKREVGNFVIDKILEKVADGDSPVKDQKNFKSLNREYAREQKGGDRTPNLRLSSDMLDALDFKLGDRTDSSIDIGAFKNKQAVKAFAHNTGFKDHPTLQSRDLVRRFIPRKSQKFDDEIRQGIREIIRGFRDGEN